MKLIIKIFLIALLLNHVQMSSAEPEQPGLVVLSGRSEPLMLPVIKLFEDQTGIKVTLKSGKSSALGQQILQEAANPSADVYVAKESGSLEYLRGKGAFEPYQSEQTEKIPAQFKASDGSWVGICGRARAVIYNKDLVPNTDLPKTLADLEDPKWKGKIAAANAGNESVVAWITALRLKQGDAKAEEFLKQLKANNIKLLSDSHTDIRKAVGRGEFAIGLVNHYYYHLQRNETDPALQNVGIVYLEQGDGQLGEIVNVAGAAIIKGAKNSAAAKKFIDFLTSAEAQKLFAEVNFEYPLLPTAAAHPQVKEALNCQKDAVLDCIKLMNVPLDQFGPELDKTQQMLDRINWY